MKQAEQFIRFKNLYDEAIRKQLNNLDQKKAAEEPEKSVPQNITNNERRNHDK